MARAGGADAAWRWDDRSGVLNAYYAAADVASWRKPEPFGGHNPLEPRPPRHRGRDRSPPLEPSRRRCARWNRSAASGCGARRRMLARGAQPLLGDAAERERQAAAGRRVADEMRGAARPRRGAARSVEAVAAGVSRVLRSAAACAGTEPWPE
jgi:3-deoxy-D-manno-octulosonic-acid transferase